MDADPKVWIRFMLKSAEIYRSLVLQSKIGSDEFAWVSSGPFRLYEEAKVAKDYDHMVIYYDHIIP